MFYRKLDIKENNNNMVIKLYENNHLLTLETGKNLDEIINKVNKNILISKNPIAINILKDFLKELEHKKILNSYKIINQIA